MPVLPAVSAIALRIARWTYLGVPRLGGVERAADPLDPHVQLVELVDPAEQLLVQAEDVADLGPRPDPVLGREAEHGQPADVAPHGQPDETGQVLLALGVTVGPGAAALAAQRPLPSMMQATWSDRAVGGRGRVDRSSTLATGRVGGWGRDRRPRTSSRPPDCRPDRRRCAMSWSSVGRCAIGPISADAAVERSGRRARRRLRLRQCGVADAPALRAGRGRSSTLAAWHRQVGGCSCRSSTRPATVGNGSPRRWDVSIPPSR